MSIKNKYSVSSIEPYQTYEWLLKKHYAKRVPNISYSFGLYKGQLLIGVLTIGKPASPTLCDGVCGKEYSKYVYELNRLCVIDGLEKNVLSYFVSTSLRMIKDNLIVVSYADTQMGHTGYIYQATNWIYTGASKERTDMGVEEGTHHRHYDKTKDYSLNRRFRSSKHRYIYFIGKMRSVFKRELKYGIEQYPKSINKRYDATYNPNVQIRLF